MVTLEECLKEFKKKKYDNFETFYELTSDYIYLYIFICLNDYNLILNCFRKVYLKILKKSKRFLSKKEYLYNVLIYTKKIILKNIKHDQNDMEYVYTKRAIIENDDELILMKLKSISSIEEKEFLLFSEYFSFTKEQMLKYFNMNFEHLLWIQTEIMIKIKSKVELNKNNEIIENFLNQLKEIKIPDICQSLVEAIC